MGIGRNASSRSFAVLITMSSSFQTVERYLFKQRAMQSLLKITDDYSAVGGLHKELLDTFVLLLLRSGMNLCILQEVSYPIVGTKI